MFNSKTKVVRLSKIGCFSWRDKVTRKDFMNKVIEIYFRDACTTAEAIDKAEKEMHISNSQFLEWFGKGKDTVKY